MKLLGYLGRFLTAYIDAVQHHIFLFRQPVHSFFHSPRGLLQLYLLRHRHPCICQKLQARFLTWQSSFQTGNIRPAFLFQEIVHSASNAMNGKYTKGHAPCIIIAFHRFNQPHSTLLNNIHNIIQLEKSLRCLKDQRLIGFYQPAASLLAPLLFVSLPQFLLLIIGQQLNLI